MDDKEKHLRWMEMMWERYKIISREEKRKEAVLRIFQELSELSKRPVEMPPYPRPEWSREVEVPDGLPKQP
jgi:hypothetical protein